MHQGQWLFLGCSFGHGPLACSPWQATREVTEQTTANLDKYSSSLGVYAAQLLQCRLLLRAAALTVSEQVLLERSQRWHLKISEGGKGGRGLGSGHVLDDLVGSQGLIGLYIALK